MQHTKWSPDLSIVFYSLWWQHVYGSTEVIGRWKKDSVLSLLSSTKLKRRNLQQKTTRNINSYHKNHTTKSRIMWSLQSSQMALKHPDNETKNTLFVVISFPDHTNLNNLNAHKAKGINYIITSTEMSGYRKFLIMIPNAIFIFTNSSFQDFILLC